MQSHELRGPDALTYILSGHGKATMVGRTTRYTYKFSVRNDDPDRKFIFVSALTGSDNESSYSYLGYIKDKKMSIGKKGNPSHPAFKAMDWFLRALVSKSEKANQAHFYHEGVCGRCGRTLTVPESIERGLGPECATKVGV